MTTEERVTQPDDPHSDDEVARLVRLAGTSGPVAAERLARVRTAVHGAWRDEYVARTRRRWLTVGVLLAAAASVVIAFAIRGRSARRHRAGTGTGGAHRPGHGVARAIHGRRCGDVRVDGHDIRRHAGHDAHERRASQAGRTSRYRPRGLRHRRRARAWCRVCGLGWRASHPAGRVSDQHPHAGGTRRVTSARSSQVRIGRWPARQTHSGA